MSSLKVEIVTLDEIREHPNADRLELGFVSGWQIVIPKGAFKRDTLCVYFPVDSILPQKVEEKLFPPGSKIKLSKSRIKTIRIRSAISQGLLARVDEVFDSDYGLYIGKDVADVLGVTKYEPPEVATNQGGLLTTSKKQSNPNFHKYTDIENWRWFPYLFQPGEAVCVTEKIHGTNFRAGYVPYHASTWWKKVKQFLGIAPKYEFVYGSHNVQFQDTPHKEGFYGQTIGKNVYAEAVEKYDLRNKLRPGEVIYAEIYGDGIQKNYLYSCQPNERKMVIIDLKLDGIYACHMTMVLRCADRNLPVVPLDGTFEYDEERIHKLVEAPSWLGSELREGVVIKPLVEEHTYMGRKILKWKSDQFLLTQEDDTH
jgi:RNA ligase (TIGR02306 family)